MQKRTVFLLQDTKENNDKLCKFFANEEDFEVIGFTTDGISGISQIAEKKPAFIITDLVLSGYDGLCVIDRIRSLNLPSKIIVLSALCR